MVRGENTISIDGGGFYPIRTEWERDGSCVDIIVDLDRATSPRFYKNLYEKLTLQLGGRTIEPAALDDAVLGALNEGGMPPKGQRQVRFSLDAAQFFGSQSNGEITLSINNQPVSVFLAGGRDNRELVAGKNHALYQLAVFETRALAMDLPPEIMAKIPYDRSLREGFDPKRHNPITDVHTHASAQISGESLFAAALKIDQKAETAADGISFPVELLEKLGVPKEEGQETIEVSGRFFSPTQDEGLTCEKEGAVCAAIRVKDLTDMQKRIIIDKMQIMGDQCVIFSEFDREFYRFRNPLTKHPEMASAMIRTIAEDCVKKGLEYVELSTSSMMLSPKWLEEMIATINDIEKNGVMVETDNGKKITGKPILRFLVAVQRDIGPQKTLNYLERIKYLMRHPYIVGVDLVGYEANRTRDFHWAFAHLAQWAAKSEGTELNPNNGWDMKRDTIFRIHAGETGKNPDNVRDAVALAHEYGVRVRVAHALNVDLDRNDARKIKTLSEVDAIRAANDNPANAVLIEDKFAFELCAPSNQTFKTKPLPHEAPFIQRNEIASIFLGSDGAGGLAITPTDLAYAALAAGASLKDLENIRAHEKGYIARQKQRGVEKRRAYSTLYKGGAREDTAFVEGYKEHIQSLPDMDGNDIPKSFKSKTPLLIGGASGDTWNQISSANQAAIRDTITTLVRTLDPKAYYFVLGRTKNEGVSKILDEEVKRHNDKYPQNKFQVLARYQGDPSLPTSELPDSISWMQHIVGSRGQVPKDMVQFLKDNNGQALLLGGSNFTQEMAEHCASMGVKLEILSTNGPTQDFVNTHASVFTIKVPNFYDKGDDKSQKRMGFIETLLKRWHGDSNPEAAANKNGQSSGIQLSLREELRSQIKDFQSLARTLSTDIVVLQKQLNSSQWQQTR